MSSHVSDVSKGPNSRIPSDLESLSKLTVQYGGWIPGPSGIRPTPEMMEKKKKLVHQIQTGWSSVRDYLLHLVFEREIATNYIGQKYVVNLDAPHDLLSFKFIPNDFPYQFTDPAAQHWVLWYFPTYRDPRLTDELINEHIQQALHEICGHGRAVWAWYENPKMSVPDLYHVQVFWKYYE